MKKLLPILVLGAVLAGAVYFAITEREQSERDEPNIESGATPEVLAEIAQYEYTGEYTDSKKRFSFRFPAQFEITMPPAETGEAILVQSSDNTVGVQILITPFGEDIDITEEVVRADIPDIRMEDVQDVEIGNGRKGVAFLSNNPAFCASPEPCAEGGGGRSRDVWFVWKGYLYQISTYAEYDKFLQNMFATWKFVQ